MNVNNDPKHLRQIIFSLQSDLEDIEIEKAEQQLTGYVHAKRGYNIESLIESMGLKEKEWKRIRFDAKVLGLNEDEIDAINKYFKK